jgi:hypothetical protein
VYATLSYKGWRQLCSRPNISPLLQHLLVYPLIQLPKQLLRIKIYPNWIDLELRSVHELNSLVHVIEIIHLALHLVSIRIPIVQARGWPVVGAPVRQHAMSFVGPVRSCHIFEARIRKAHVVKPRASWVGVLKDIIHTQDSYAVVFIVVLDEGYVLVLGNYPAHEVCVEVDHLVVVLEGGAENKMSKLDRRWCFGYVEGLSRHGELGAWISDWNAEPLYKVVKVGDWIGAMCRSDSVVSSRYARGNMNSKAGEMIHARSLFIPIRYNISVSPAE